MPCLDGKFWRDYYHTRIQCPLGTHFNTTDNSCSSCPVGKAYDEKLKICVSKICPKGKNFSPLLLQCITCIEPQHWDKTLQSCVSCPVGYVYDKIQD